MSRRGRQQRQFPARSRRPTDKELKYVLQTATNSNVTTTLKTTTFPCTIVGLRWDLQFLIAIATANPIVNWIIVVVHDGNSANTISQSNASDMYTPEKDVMAFGTVALMQNDSVLGPGTMHIQGQTKTMRKMAQGDQLQFVTIANTASSVTVSGVIQFFCKT